MTEPFQEGIPATDYAKREGITPDAVYLRVKAGRLGSYKLGKRVYVYPLGDTIEASPLPADGAVTLPTLMEASRDIRSFLEALADRDRRMIEPWEKRVDALERQQAEDREQIGNLKREVSELRRDLAGYQRVDRVRRREGQPDA